MQSADVRDRHRAVIPAPTEVDEVDLVAVRTYWQLVRQRFVRNKLAVFGAITLLIIIAIAIIVPFADRRPVPEVEPRA